MAHELDGVRAVLTTDVGEITLEFFPDKAPKHVENFVKLSEKGFYDGTRFHRVIPGFMIQGGDPNTKQNDTSRWGFGGPGHRVDAEFNDIPHERGILSMARSADPNSAGSQFFLMHAKAPSLDNQYTVFGRMVDGFEALDAIAGAPCVPGGEGSRPVEPVMIQSVQILRGGAS